MGTDVMTADAPQAIPAGSLSRRAALHILNRLGYGPRPGDIDRVLDLGIERYIDDQLSLVPDPDLEARLASFPYLRWSMAETWSYYQQDQQSQNNAAATRTNFIGELHNQLRGAQLARAAHSRNQLLEVMTGFWFNHFNVNLPDDYVRYSAHDYEREMRRHALGKFRDVLNASAHHPAMMSYLDNYLSRISRTDPRTGRLLQGLNENYGRELLELHTVGVDAGYTQEDVYEAARVLTGWGLNNVQGRFVFSANNHDPKATTVFGLTIPQGLGQQSGEMLLDFLARHEKTAHFISTKLVRHFVADDPPRLLVARVTDKYLATDGDIPSMLRVIFTSNEFWAEAFGQGKYKDPFQYVVSTLRGLDADVRDGRALAAVLNNMGQPQYACIPPTGWTDKGREWVNPSSHMYRMNFALDLVSNVTGGNTAQPFAGVFVDVPRLLRNNAVDPEDGQAVIAFFNREVFGGALSSQTTGAAATLNSPGAPSNTRVGFANRLAGLLLAGPEAQGR